MADSEVRQKFEATVKDLSETLDKLRPGTGPGVGVLLMMAWDEAWREAYEAGEIAMKEKAAQLANSCAEILPPEHRMAATWIGDKIRALPLSVAEESKKEKA